MENKKEFIFLIEPNDFLTRVNLNGHDSSIKEAVVGADGIVSPVDISKRVSRDALPGKKAAKVELRAMPTADLKALIRSIPNKKGEKVYENSQISAGHFSSNSLFQYRAFANISSLLGLNGLASLFESFDFAGIANASATTITCTDQNKKFVAFYVPPIVETISKESVRIPLENLRVRANKEKQLVLPDYSCSNTIWLPDVVKRWDKIMSNSAISSLQVVRDGVHRMSLAHTIGAPQYVIKINGFKGEAPSVPVQNKLVIKTTTGTEKLEDRYLGLHPDGWTDEPFVGIDG